MTKISLKRKLTDYTRVQLFISEIIRGHRFFINRKKVQEIEYLDIGCGTNMHHHFVNLDYSWLPGIDVCWDITRKKLPFADCSFKGVYSEHCFEHVSYEQFKSNMHEIFRVLKPSGTLRLIMPDGEIYFDIYNKRKNGSKEKMPYEENYISGMDRINGIFRNHGHQFIYDFETVAMILRECGFADIRKEQFRSGKDEMLLLDTESRAIESLYVEAVK